MSSEEEEDEEFVSRLISNWKRTRRLTYDLAKSVPVSILNKKVGRPIYDTIGKQIYEMALMQRDYTNALEGEEPDFSLALPRNFSVGSRAELSNALNDADAHFYEVINGIGDWYEEKYDILGNAFSAYNIVNMMIEHETYHQGQFAALGYMLNIKFPASWTREWSLHLG